MSTADSWDLRVPRNAAELEEFWAEARRHGVEPGGHLRVVTPSAEPELGAKRPRRQLRFAAMGDGPSDISTNTDRYLSEGFGQQ